MKRYRREHSARIPTTSMADLAFLLIIFFMLTAVFSAARGLKLELPAPDEAGPLPGAEAVFVKVGADGSVLVDCKPMERDQILPYLGPQLLRDPEKPVILYTDASAPYQAMIAVYDLLGQPQEETHGYRVRNVAVPTQSEVRRYTELFGLNPFESQCDGP